MTNNTYDIYKTYGIADMTADERVKAIRAELKAHGYNSRRIGVTLKYAGYSSVINVTIKELAIDKKEIENIADKYKFFERDERTGEILSGGNTYIRVSYDWRLTA